MKSALRSPYHEAEIDKRGLSRPRILWLDEPRIVESQTQAEYGVIVRVGRVATVEEINEWRFGG